MGELGFFRGERVELIGGDIVRLSPNSPLHGEVVTLIAEKLWSLFGRGYRVREQQPVVIGGSEPEPDIAVAVGKPGDYRNAHPITALLVIEVAQTSAEYDRQVKAPLYARAGIPQYWLVNLDEGCVEVYCDPAPLGGGYVYRSRQVYVQGEQLSPLQKPEATVTVEELLLGTKVVSLKRTGQGRIFTVNTLKVPSHTTLRGAGAATVLRAKASIGEPPSPNNRVLSNADAERNNTGIVVKDLVVDGGLLGRYH